MNKIEIANECIGKLTTIIQEQYKELEECKIALCRHQHYIKLLSDLSLDYQQRINICEVFDNCNSEEEVKEAYLRLVGELR
jgi:hypothetical protein